MNTKTLYINKFEIDLNDFETSNGFTNYFYNFLSRFINCKLIIYHPNIIHIKLSNGLSSIEFIFVYPYIDRGISYKIFFKDKTSYHINELYLIISYYK